MSVLYSRNDRTRKPAMACTLPLRKCKGCGGWGKGLVDPCLSLCNHCKRQANRPIGAFNVPTEQQAQNPIVLANPELEQRWMRHHYAKLANSLTWVTSSGEKRDQTDALPLPDGMNFVQCKLMAEYHGFGAEKAERKYCSCDQSSWIRWATGCSCPVQNWIIYHASPLSK